MGLYQIGRLALLDLKYINEDNEWIGKNNMNSQEEFLDNEKIQKQLSDKPKKLKEQCDIKTWILKTTGKDITRCPICQQGTLRRSHDIPSKFHQVIVDTS